VYFIHDLYIFLLFHLISLSGSFDSNRKENREENEEGKKKEREKRETKVETWIVRVLRNK